jgi:hypothetical protein
MIKEQEDDLKKYLKESNIQFSEKRKKIGYTAEDLLTDSTWLANGEMKTESESKHFIMYIVKKSGGKVKWKR